MRKTIAVDFDGVIHTYDKGWHDGTIYGDLVFGAEEALTRLMEHFAVYILSTRSPRQIVPWLREKLSWERDAISPYRIERIPFWVSRWQVPFVLGVTQRKLPAVAYVDDRAVVFQGSWSITAATVEARAGLDTPVVHTSLARHEGPTLRGTPPPRK